MHYTKLTLFLVLVTCVASNSVADNPTTDTKQQEQRDLFAEPKGSTSSSFLPTPTQQQATGGLQLLLAAGCGNSSLLIGARTLRYAYKEAPMIISPLVIAAGGAVMYATGILAVHVARQGLRNIQSDDPARK